MRRNKNKKIIILSLIGILILMTVGYAAFQTNLDIKGTSKVSSNWDIRITNVKAGTIMGDAEQAKQPTWNELTASVEANLYQKGDSIEYIITVENKGTIDAILNNINAKETTNEAIKFTYSGVNKNDKLYKGESTEIIVKIEYNPDFNGTPEIGSAEINITLEYIQAIVGGIEITNPNLYVSSSGNDETGIGSKTNPYKTIKKAYEEVKEEGTIYIMDDITQTETLNFSKNKNITLTSYGVEHSIIRENKLTESIIYQTAGNLTLNNIIIDGNNIEAKSALLVLNNNDAILNINDNTIIKNGNNQLIYANEENPSSDTLGGGICANHGILNISNSKVLNNQSDYGGGIYANSLININDSTISYNTSKSNGGGITANSNVQIKSSEVSHNTTTGAGGGMYTIGNEINLISVNFSDNSADLTGGGIFSQKHLDISENSNISNNKAKQPGGGIKFLCNTNYECTGLYIKNSTISNNTAYNGGGLEFSNSVIKISSSNISNNTATEYAGGMHITSFKEALFENIIVNGNKAVYGGGINTSGVTAGLTLNINNSQIKNNTATGNAGGIRIDRVSVVANGTTISDNKAPNYAGLTCRGDKDIPVKFIFNGNTIRNNIATGETGGIFITNYCTYTRNSGTVCGNKPTNSYETHATCPTT